MTAWRKDGELEVLQIMSELLLSKQQALNWDSENQIEKTMDK